MTGRRRFGTHKKLAAVMGLAIGFSCLLVSSAASEEIGGVEKLLPRDALFCLSWKNPRKEPAFVESAICKIAREQEMDAFLVHVKSVYMLFREAFRAQMPIAPELVEELLRNELSFAVTGIAENEYGLTEPGLVISGVFERPPDEVEQALLDAVRIMAPGTIEEPQQAFDYGAVSVKSLALPELRLYYCFMGQRMVAWTSKDDVQEALRIAEGSGDSLADSPYYKKVIAETGGPNAMLSLYANTELLFGILRANLPPEQSAILGAPGLHNILAAGLSSRFSDGGIRDSFYLYAPGERGGILGDPGETVDLSLLRYVPQNAELMSLSRLNAQGAYSTFLEVVKIADADTYEELLSSISAAEKRVGFSINDDLLGSLGNQMLVYFAPHETVLLLEIKDRAGFESCIGKLVSQTAGQAELNQMEYKGAVIRHLDVTAAPVPFSPSYTYLEQFAVFGLFPQTLKSFLTRVEADGPAITDNEDFKRVVGASLGDCCAISYSDTASKLVDFYSLLVIGAHALHGVPQVPIQPQLMPHSSVVAPHLFGQTAVTVNRGDGILYQCFSPVGAAGSLLATLGSFGKMTYGSGNVATVSILAGMLMPALQRARTAAIRVSCLNNLRQLSGSLALYHADHGKYPEKLEDLCPQYAQQMILLCPSDRNPMTIGKGLKCSYHYVGNLTAGDGTVIIAYDKRGNHRDGRNVLFADLHVVQIAESRLRSALQESLRAVKRQDWEGYSPERRAEIEAFYADRR